MSFRLRVFGMIMFVAVAATAATAWLTLREATRQARESAAAGQQDIARITAALRRYGLTHGGWDGVSATVRDLAKSTGQRIRIGLDSGAQLADSDVLLGRTPRAGGGASALLVDPRATLSFPRDYDVASLAKLTATAVEDYHAGTAYAACLSRAGLRVNVGTGSLGVPTFTAAAGAGSASATGCALQQPTRAAIAVDLGATHACALQPHPRSRVESCLRRLFVQRTNGFGPQPLTVRLGALDQAGPTLAATPTVIAACGVAAAAVLAALVLGRTVLHPVRALTEASRGLGAGDLARRVPASGSDEIATLGRSFNKMADSLQASEERQRRMVGDIAHELRTPLSNVRGYLEALRDGVLEPTPELFESLEEEVLLQQRIVADLQDLALAEAGALTYHCVDTDAGGLLQSCRAAHQARAEAAGVALEVAAPDPMTVHVDPARLRQALGNLVDNAIRHTPAGGSVRLVLDGEGDRARIRVEDAGVGIAAQDLPHVFDRFWRADASRGRATGGSGLGLSIARQIVLDHGGTVDVASRVGAGTVFTLVLPLPQR